jgi:hypothetical protein
MPDPIISEYKQNITFYSMHLQKMAGAGAKSVAGQIMSIMFNIATVALRIIQT